METSLRRNYARIVTFFLVLDSLSPLSRWRDDLSKETSETATQPSSQKNEQDSLSLYLTTLLAGNHHYLTFLLLGES